MAHDVLPLLFRSFESEELSRQLLGDVPRCHSPSLAFFDYVISILLVCTSRCQIRDKKTAGSAGGIEELRKGRSAIRVHRAVRFSLRFSRSRVNPRSPIRVHRAVSLQDRGEEAVEDLRDPGDDARLTRWPRRQGSGKGGGGREEEDQEDGCTVRPQCSGH